MQPFNKLGLPRNSIKNDIETNHKNHEKDLYL